MKAFRSGFDENHIRGTNSHKGHRVSKSMHGARLKDALNYSTGKYDVLAPTVQQAYKNAEPKSPDELSIRSDLSSHISQGTRFSRAESSVRLSKKRL